MKTREIRLEGRKATLAGISKAIAQHCTDKGLQRVEVNFSTQSEKPVTASAIKDKLTSLFREEGVSGVYLSVRPMLMPMQNAMGEHQVRFIYVAESTHADAEVEKGPIEWIKARLAGVRAVPPAAGEPSQPTVSQVSARDAAVALNKALSLAVRNWRANRPRATGEVAQIVIAVHDHALDRALRTLVDPTREESHLWFARALREQKVLCAAPLSIRYDLRVPESGDGTDILLTSDLEVRLLNRTDVNTAVPPSAPSRDSEDTMLPGNEGDAEGTLLPDSAKAPKAPRVSVRVLGTLSERFDRPFDLKLDGIPATFNRSALEDAGFGRAYPTLKMLVSRRCDLNISLNAEGQLELKAQTRGNEALPMFYRVDDHAPLAGTTTWPQGRVQLLVNSPEGVLDVATGKRLTPLLIEVSVSGPKQSLPRAA